MSWHRFLCACLVWFSFLNLKVHVFCQTGINFSSFFLILQASHGSLGLLLLCSDWVCSANLSLESPGLASGVFILLLSLYSTFWMEFSVLSHSSICISFISVSLLQFNILWLCCVCMHCVCMRECTMHMEGKEWLSEINSINSIMWGPGTEVGLSG